MRLSLRCTGLAPQLRQRSLTVAAVLQRPSPPSQRLVDQAQQQAAPTQLRPPPVRPPPSARQEGRSPQRMAPPRPQQAAPQPHRKVTLAVVGDVHSQWDADSEAALAWLGADVAVFVGDFGEEVVQLVERIAALPQPKVVCLGNHDAWFSLTPNGRRRYARAMLQSSSLAAREAYTEGGSTPAIARQLDALGTDHIGYSSKRFPELGLTLVGARPFSKGGKQWSDVADFYEEHYGVGGHQDSALRILDVALGAAEGDCRVVVAHNGPAGLGGRRHCICGVDWTEPEADFGDPDLQEALDMMHAQGVRVPLVLFGHMHSQLKGRGHRNMVEVDPATGTVYINAAVLPSAANV
ncbi:metallophosphoesterase [Chlorella sorokiniana]|uniref:Metallophosphoesterase n=1 Tax=Chlorella sorokiniana TaxID=3076 RepID=A0A2P6TYG4_CHLSO|nr:metallophosphoesterase [Chlorella sorokiniana]|eukprot:PRW59109.1 metallophosphoesterase [Chlorella sorokiniana]